MSWRVLTGTPARTKVAARVVTLAALLFLWAQPPCHAGQAGAQFTVDIHLRPTGNLPQPGVCRSSSRIGTFGEVIMIDCATGKVVAFAGDTSRLPWSAAQDGYFRFATGLSQAGIPLEPDQFWGAGTITSWRVVNFADWEYLELMVGW
jgi:hypothetical protein